MNRKKWMGKMVLSLSVCAISTGLFFHGTQVRALDELTGLETEESLTSVTPESSEVFVQVGETTKVKINREPVSAMYYSSGWQISPAGVAEAELEEENGELYVVVTGEGVGSTKVTLRLDTFEVVLQVTVTGSPVKTHSKKEIRNFIKKSKVTTSAKVKYKKKPKVKAPYAAGDLSAATKKSALKMLNNIRYIAGLDANVKLDSQYGKLAQAASLVNAVNGQLSHFPSQPKKMKKSLYQTGLTGASSSNIAMGFSNLNATLVNGWMADDDSGNIDRVGHRRWVLNPTMKKTGFGAVNSYMAMYSFDRSGTGTQTNVYWPAQTMPISYFDNQYPWSVSTGQTLTSNKIKVTLTRISDKKTWTFSSSTKKSSKKSGYFNVENGNYGLTGCIIFRPNNIKYKAKDKFQVTITGVPTGEISYTVEFFKL